MRQSWHVVVPRVVSYFFLPGLLRVICLVVDQDGRFMPKPRFPRQGWLLEMNLSGGGFVSISSMSMIFRVAQLGVAAVSTLLATRRPIQPQKVIGTVVVRDVGKVGRLPEIRLRMRSPRASLAGEWGRTHPSTEENPGKQSALGGITWQQLAACSGTWQQPAASF